MVLGLALLTMTGCRVEGRIDVRSTHAVDVDVTVHGRRSPYCTSDLAGLSTTPGVDANGVVTSCRYLGTVEPSQFGWAFGVATAGEYITVVFNPLQIPVEGPGGMTGENELDAVDVTVGLPGQVVENNGGAASGTELRITDPEVLELPGGLRFAALTHPGPPLWVWWLTGGVLVGATSVIGVLWLRRGRDAVRAAPAPDDLGDAPDAGPGAPDAVPAPGAVPAPPGAVPETPGAGPHTPNAGSATPDDPGEFDDSMFRRPADTEDGAYRRPADPSIWAPPDDR